MNMRQQLRLLAGIDKPADRADRAACPANMDALAGQLARGWRLRCKAAAQARMGGCTIFDVATVVAQVADVLQLPAPSAVAVDQLVRHVLQGFEDEGLVTGWWPAEGQVNISWGDK